ncbi:MAG: Rid family hydrolase, partial [Myxococcota bacterium]
MLIAACQQLQADEKNIKKIVSTPDAPAAIGPYSQGVLFVSQGVQTLYCSGQIALDPKTGEIVPGTVSDQARRVMDNLKAIITAGGLS